MNISCTVKGVRFCNKTAYPTIDDTLRQDHDNPCSSSHFKGSSPFSGLICLRDGFPPEYMHLICLGVMKRLLNYWVKPNQKLHLPFKLHPATIITMSDKMILLSKYFQNDFHRRLCGLDCLGRWEASDYKKFLTA